MLKKIPVIAIITLLLLTSSGCFEQKGKGTNRTTPLPNNNKTIIHHLIYLGENKDWIGEYEVSGETNDGNQYSNNSKGILTLTYKNKDYSQKDKVTYGLDSELTKARVNGYMSPNGILVLNINNEDAVWLENNPSFAITVTVIIHDTSESFNLSLKSK